MIDANKTIKATTAVSVSVVALIAAVISYTHIEHVAIKHGQSVTDSRLIPFSVDGLIAAASLTLFYASRNRLQAPGLARWMLGLGVGATVAANGLYGWSSGMLGTLLSAWPAVAFIGAAELTIWLVRAATTVRTGTARNSRANDIRQWARAQGHEISDKGRIPADITEAYRAANNGHKTEVLSDEDAKDLFVPSGFDGSSRE